MTENRTVDPQLEAMKNKCYCTQRFQVIDMEPEVEIVVDKTHQVYPKLVPQDSLYEGPQLNTSFSCLLPVEKPWGKYWDLYRTKDTVIKKLVVFEGHRFSYQYHNERDEIWMITSGVGQLWLNNEIQTVGPGFSVFIKRGDKHRLANAGSGDLVFFEIQYGNCSEEDIVRLVDDYART